MPTAAPSTSTDSIKVPWGTTSNLGVAGALAGAVGLIISVVFKMDNDQAVAIASAVLLILSYVGTLAGRFVQAKEVAAGVGQAKANAVMGAALQAAESVTQDDLESAIDRAVHTATVRARAIDMENTAKVAAQPTPPVDPEVQGQGEVIRGLDA
jgi:hypothetical protein